MHNQSLFYQISVHPHVTGVSRQAHAMSIMRFSIIRNVNFENRLGKKLCSVQWMKKWKFVLKFLKLLFHSFIYIPFHSFPSLLCRFVPFPNLLFHSFPFPSFQFLSIHFLPFILHSFASLLITVLSFPFFLSLFLGLIFIFTRDFESQ